MYARSLTLNAGLSKKTHRPRGRLVTGGAVAAQVSVGDQGAPSRTKPAGGGTHFQAEIQQGKRFWSKEPMNFMTLWMADAERTGNSVF